MASHHFIPASAIVAALTATSVAHAQDIRFMAWNINGGQQTPAELEVNARTAVDQLGPVDVVTIQEVISEDQVEAIARGFGLDHYAISDFSPPISITNAWFRSLEVAVVSRFPIEAAGEWDTTGRNPNGDGFTPRTSDEDIPSEELPVNIMFGDEVPSRGFLRVDLEGGWSVYSVHWKSSRGDSCNASDLGNAQQREDQAHGISLDIARALDAGRTVVVGGDYNIQAPNRALRVGQNPAIDCNPMGTCDGVCGPDGIDGYDDSISILMDVDPTARLLSAELDNTFIAEFFPDGAIDHILVAGPNADRFAMATTPMVDGDSYLDSDHRPVLANVSFEDVGDQTDAERIERLIREIRERLVEIEGLVRP